MNCFSVNKLVEDVEKSFIKNINSQEKVDSLPQVLNDFFLLRKFYVKFQSSPQSLIQTGIISIKYECFWLDWHLFCFSVPDIKLQSLLSDPDAFVVDLTNFMDSRNVTITDVNILQITQLDLKIADLERGR